MGSSVPSGPLIYTPGGKGTILFAAEFQDGGKRFMRVRRRFDDGTLHDDIHQVDDVGPLLFIGGLGDVDDIAVRDIVQMMKESPPPERPGKPDVTQLYLDFQEGRRMEMSGRRTYPMWPRKKDRHARG